MTLPASALPAPSAILFDWDNTLVDSWAVIHHAMTATFEALGERPWTLEETRRNVRQSARDAFPALFGARADQATAVFYRTYEADHLDRLSSEEHTSDIQSLMRISYAVFCLKKKHTL